jgi:hypothetical protein
MIMKLKEEARAHGGCKASKRIVVTCMCELIDLYCEELRLFLSHQSNPFVKENK